MALRHSAGRIWITDPTNTEIVFDTNERLFIATDFLSGSVSIPQRYAEWNRAFNGQETRTRVDIEDLYTLGSVNGDANTVVGAFKVTTQSSPQGVHDFGWFSAGGTYIHSQLARIATYNNIAHQNAAGGYSGYSFLAASGTARLHERVVFDCPRPEYSGWYQSINQNPMTIEYKLYVGSYL
jgi:hypothetical protein